MESKSINTFKDVQVILKLTYGLIPIVAGADKFTNLLTDWSHYLNPSLAGILPIGPQFFMMIVGKPDLTLLVNCLDHEFLRSFQCRAGKYAFVMKIMGIYFVF